MSLPTRPGFQKPTKASSSSSSSSSASASGGVAPCARWNGNYSAGVSPVRGLSPVRGNFPSVMRQDIDIARSHTNPLFSTRTSDIGRMNNTPTKSSKDSKENREKQEPWRVPPEKSQYGSKTLCTTPGKSSRTTGTMRFTTPPKPVVKRKILAENREFGTGTPTRMKEEDTKQVATASSTAKRELLVAEPGAVSQSRNDESQCRAGDGLSSLSPERSSAEPSKPRSPLVSIEELQKRIQKFLQDEGTTTTTTTADVSSSVTMSPRQSVESLRRSLSGALATEESSSCIGLEEPHFQPVVAPYSPRPEFSRARKSPTPPVSMEGNISPVRVEDSLIQENLTPTYDPKNNFLSPRPQFLRYRPLRRLELLRKSAEGTLADLDLESPATDAESPRMGSEKDDKEESELSQDVSQEIQSLNSSLESPTRPKVESELEQDVSQELQWLKTSPECPPRCKVSSHELFKAADPVNGEIVQLNTEEFESSFSRMEPPKLDDSAGVDVPSTRSEYQDLTKEEDQEELEEADLESNSSSVWCHAFSIVTVLALVSLVVMASGSTSLLPTSFHHNHISHLWKTSRTTEPIRQFLQTTEGLWAKNLNLEDFALTSPDILRVGWVHISSRIDSVDLSKAVENGKVLWSSCMEYSARTGRLAKESFYKFKASLEEKMEFYSSQGQDEVNEWDWVSDYEFVVPHDMFDPVEAYANILARVESWEVKSFWSSVIQSYAKLHPSSELAQEKNTDQNLDISREGRNATLVALPSTPEDEPIVSFRPAPAPATSVMSDVSFSSPGQDFERDSKVPEESDEGYVKEPNAVSGGLLQESLVLVPDDDQELDVAAFETELSATYVVNIVAENVADAIVEVAPFSSPGVGLTEYVQVAEPIVSKGQSVEVVQLWHDAKELHHIVEDLQVLEPILSQDQDLEVVQLWHDSQEIRETRIVEDLQVDDPNLSQDHPLLLQERFQGKSSSDRPGMEIQIPFIPEENNGDSFISQETKQETPLSSILEKLLQAPSLQTTAAIVTSLLLVASVVALLFLHRINARSHNRRPANLKASSIQGTIPKPSAEPQLKETEANRFRPVEDNTGDDFLMEDSSPVRLSSNHVKPFSTPYPVKTGTPIRTLRKVMDMDKTPQKPFKHVADDTMVSPPQKSFKRIADDDILRSPDILSPGVLEDASLGRFVTLVPVVHNEGTTRERVQLTPVRRSSRIRTKVQNSPCNLMHPHHLCNC